MKKRFGLILIVGLILSASLVSAQTDSGAPYLYYYSQMLGGIIIEHPDGSDSRLIGSDVIPPDLSGIGGPGWSPSGKYFAAYGETNSEGVRPNGSAFLIDTQGKSVVPWLKLVTSTVLMEWSPKQDLLLVVGTALNTFKDNHFNVFFWLVDPTQNSVLAEFGANLDTVGTEASDVTWEPDQRRIQFFIAPQTTPSDEYFNVPQTNSPQYFRITMSFDGTVVKEPVSRSLFHSRAETDPVDNTENNVVSEYALSPSGDYEIRDHTIHDFVTGQVAEFPRNSTGTACGAFRWNSTEDYIVILNGTAASDGCGWPVLGITDSRGSLWRELGNCSWEANCAAWLPKQVDVTTLPQGQIKPIQLDPVAYQPDSPMWFVDDTIPPSIRLRCEGTQLFEIFDAKTGASLFQLANTQNERCPYDNTYPYTNPEEPMVSAYDPQDKLLATFHDNNHVTVWSLQTNPGKPLLRLNTRAYQLEFTPDDKQLRARNVNAWKIYNVADILAAADLKP